MQLQLSYICAYIQFLKLLKIRVMKKLIISFMLLIASGLLTVNKCHAQVEYLNTTVVIVKDNGVKFIGELLAVDSREVLLKTEDMGEIYIPRYVIKEIQPIISNDNKSVYTDELFASRYFITTNGLPIKKGENYIQWNLYGPDFQFGVADNFGVGVMTSWGAIPIIANAKYSIDLGKNKSMALGILAGTGSWALPEFGLLLPFVAFTLGDRTNNLTFSTGYGSVFYQEEDYNYLTDQTIKTNYREGRVLLSIAGMAKITEKFSLVFDTFISPWGPEQTKTDFRDISYVDNNGNWVEKYELETYTEKSPNLAILLPGIRWQLDADRAFQFGFTGFYFDGEFLPAPIPMVQWYRRL